MYEQPGAVNMRRLQYLDILKKVYSSIPTFIFYSVSFFISTSYPFIGASPDGLVDCECCERGVCEVKVSKFYFYYPINVLNSTLVVSLFSSIANFYNSSHNNFFKFLSHSAHSVTKTTRFQKISEAAEDSKFCLQKDEDCD